MLRLQVLQGVLFNLGFLFRKFSNRDFVAQRRFHPFDGLRRLVFGKFDQILLRRTVPLFIFDIAPIMADVLAGNGCPGQPSNHLAHGAAPHPRAYIEDNSLNVVVIDFQWMLLILDRQFAGIVIQDEIGVLVHEAPVGGALAESDGT